MNKYLLLIIAIVLITACQDDGVSYAPEPDKSVDSTIQGRIDEGETPLDIYSSDNSLLDSLYGKVYAGGYIFYFNPSDGSGLVADLKDLPGLYNWGCEGTYIGGTYTSFGTGAFNTENIVSKCTVTGTAAEACQSSEAQGYTDWYLPSSEELDLMHTNLSQRNLGNFKLYTYWSSSEKDKNNAYRQFFNLNKNLGYYDKDLIKYAVRSARDF
ncbi:MAG: hypothetical protein ABF321_04980 [Bacteroidia bacterium]